MMERFNLFRLGFGGEAKALLLTLACLLIGATLSCEPSSNSSTVSNTLLSPSPTLDPIVNSQADQQNSDETVVGASTANGSQNSIRLKCKDAAMNTDRLLCNRFVRPPQSRNDSGVLDPFEVTYSEIDLNSDGVKELVAWESSWAGTSGGKLTILARSGNRLKVLFDTEMTWSPIILLTTSHHGWQDLGYRHSGGGVMNSFVAVIHNSSSYTTVGGANLTAEQPAGRVLIPQNWRPSTFGPISPNP